MAPFGTIVPFCDHSVSFFFFFYQNTLSIYGLRRTTPVADRRSSCRKNSTRDISTPSSSTNSSRCNHRSSQTSEWDRHSNPYCCLFPLANSARVETSPKDSWCLKMHNHHRSMDSCPRTLVQMPQSLCKFYSIASARESNESISQWMLKCLLLPSCSDQ